MISFKTKLALLPIFSTLLTTLLIGGALFLFMLISFESEAKEKSKKAANMILLAIQRETESLKEDIKSLASRESIRSTTNMISGYQNIKEYQPLIFDSQKEKIALEFYDTIRLGSMDSIANYDTSGELASFSFKTSDKVFAGYTTYSDKETIRMLSESPYNTAYKGGAIPSYIENSSKECKHSDKDSMLYTNDKELLIHSCETIAETKSVGVLKGGKYIKKRIADELFRSIGVTFELGLLEEFDADQRDYLASSGVQNILDTQKDNEISQIETDDYFISGSYMDTIDGKRVYLVLKVSKKEFYAKSGETVNLLLLIILGTMLISIPISSLFAKYNIKKPIDGLLGEIRVISQRVHELAQSHGLKLKSDTIGDLGSSDEIIVLQKEFLSMSQMIQKTFDDLDSLNRTLSLQVEAELEKARKKDEIIYEQSRRNSLSELLINIAHHWRQPLNTISLRVQLIEELVEQESIDKNLYKEYAKIIVEELSYLSSIITQFTEFYERQESSNPSTNLNATIRTALDFIKPDIELVSLKVECDVDEKINLPISQRYLVEIIISMILNIKDIAKLREIKTPKATIVATKRDGTVRLEISDNCGGIDKKIINTVFDPYTTTHFKSRNKGMGLFLVKNIVELRLEGTLGVENTTDGAKFIIECKDG